MKITFIVHAEITQKNGAYYSPLASIRYRVLPAALMLSQNGYEINILPILSSEYSYTEVEQHLNTDCIVFSKAISGISVNLAKDAKKHGAKVIFDICDHHFASSDPLAPEYLQMLNEATYLTANTKSMKEALQYYTEKEVMVIEDPYELPKGIAKFNPEKNKLRLVWFGHASNFNTIESMLNQLSPLSHELTLHLSLITQDIGNIRQYIEDFNQKNSNFSMQFIEWSLDNLTSAMQTSDVVLIPSNDDETKKTKSANRLLESVQSGCWTVAFPLPSYKEFENFAWINEKLVDGIVWAYNNREQAIAKIQAGQDYIKDRYSKHMIGQKWVLFMKTISKEGIKLNLGCGDKILDGYINVDVVESRAGRKPDILCDLHHLTPFFDNSVDEILSVHVVEHFWQWEVLNILKEWVRVLKPGGTMILECPNLISACEEFAKNPDIYAEGGAEGQRSMWVLYGDPAWKDPYMIHRWGYTPNSLAKLMERAGLINITQQPAQFKLREPRDMRLVGFKPTNFV